MRAEDGSYEEAVNHWTKTQSALSTQNIASEDTETTLVYRTPQTITDSEDTLANTSHENLERRNDRQNSVKSLPAATETDDVISRKEPSNVHTKTEQKDDNLQPPLLWDEQNFLLMAVFAFVWVISSEIINRFVNWIK